MKTRNENSGRGFNVRTLKPITLATVLALLTALLPAWLRADPLDHWQWRNPMPPAGNYQGVAFGNGVFVAAAATSQVLVSSDGHTWSTYNHGWSGDNSCISFANDRFFIGGYDARLYSSSDGRSWTFAGWATGGWDPIFDVGYGNGRYVAVGPNSLGTTTDPAVSWWPQTYLAGGLNIAYGNRMLVVVGGNGLIANSLNTSNWTHVSSGTSVHLRSVTFGGLFAAVGDAGTIVTSSDGTNWTTRVSGTSQSLLKVVYGDGLFVAVGAGGTILTSTNGADWANPASGTTQVLRGVSYGNSTWVTVGDGSTVLTSADGIAWTPVVPVTTQRLCSVTYGASNYVAVGFGGTVLTSSDGVAWTSQASGISTGLYSVAYGNGTFAAVGQAILSSTNSRDWITRDEGPDYDFETVAYLNGAFMAVGANGAIKVSPDGTTWSNRSSGTTNTLYGVAHGNGAYVVVGAGGTIRTSADGLTWTNRTSGTTKDLNGVTYGGGLFVAQGNYGVILTSTNGSSWTSRYSGTGAGFVTSAYGFNRFVAVGMYGVILVSTDGISWTTKNPGTTSLLIGICAAPDSFVAVGDGGWILQSDTFPPDGIWGQPESQVVNAGQTAQFSVGTWWAAPLGFQWRKNSVALTNGANISGATTALLNLANVNGLDAGGYSVVISNAQGCVTSQVATLTVVDPVISSQPVSQYKNAGESVTFSVTAAGAALHYQWCKDGAVVDQATAPVLTLTNLQGADAGYYSVVVSNQFGCVTSAVAVLTVNLAMVDIGFNPGTGSSYDNVNALAVQADGKILVGGRFWTLVGQARTCIGRLNGDDTLDTTFNPGAAGGAYTHVGALAVQKDGRILVGGEFTTLGGQVRSNLARLNPDGTLDAGFNPRASGQVSSLAVQTDGKILVGGGFTNLAGQTRTKIGRLNGNGTLDTSFNPGANGAVVSLAVQADGKILVGGEFTTLAGQTRSNIARLNASGTLDTEFNPGADGGYVTSLALQADGKILVGGYFTTLGGQPRTNLARVNADGTLDSGFNPGTGVGPNGGVYSLAVQADGKILVGGGFTWLGGQTRYSLGRLNADGTLDNTFNLRAGGGGYGPYVFSLALQADGMILVGGSFDTLAGQARRCLGRLHNTGAATQSLTSDGSTITWLRGGTSPEVWSTSFDASTNNGTEWFSLGDGTHVTGGLELTGLSVPLGSNIRGRGFVTGGRFNSSSWFIDTITGPALILFQPSSITNNAGTTASIRVVAGGTEPLDFQWCKDGAALTNSENISGATSAMLNLNNLLKSDAGGYSVVITNSEGNLTSLVATLTVIDPAINGQPVSQNREPGESVSFSVTAAGTAPLSYQWRQNATNLSEAGSISGVSTPTLTLTNLQGYEAGNYTVIVSNLYGSITSAVAVLTVNLVTLDSGFNPGANGDVFSLAVQPDGKILVGGRFDTLGGQPRVNIGRLNADGTVDSGFHPGMAGGDYPFWVWSLAVQADGRILLGGAFTTVAGQPRTNLARLNADGTLDPGFNPGTGGGYSPGLYSLAVQADAKILVGGRFTTLGGQARSCIGRLNADGSLDSSFNPGAGSDVCTLALQADGKILVGGRLMVLGGALRYGIGRLNANGSVDSTFNPGVDNEVRSLAVQADGKILVGGGFSTLGGQPRTNIARLNANGTVDTGFNPGADNVVRSLALQADGKILVGGDFTTLGGQTRNFVGRLNTDGSVDATFNPGANGVVWSLAVQADGKILAGGEGLGVPGGLGRLNNTDPATQSLSCDGSMITWLRGGTSPEVWRTSFDYSTNGTDWLSLGAGTRITGGWQRAALPALPTCTLRARGFVTGGQYDGSSWFVESTAQFIPQIQLAILINDGSFGFRTNQFGCQFGFNLAGVAGQTVVIEGSTNLADWIPLATNLLGPGPLNFSDPGSTNLPARFYRARLED